MKLNILFTIAVLALTGCSKDPWDYTPRFVFPHSGYTVLRYYQKQDDVIVEFGFLDSFTNHCDPISTFKTEDGVKILTVTVHGKIAGSGTWPELKTRVPRIENGNYAFSISAPGLDPKTDKVFYRDDQGLHEIPFEGVRQESFKPYIPVEIGDDLFN